MLAPDLEMMIGAHESRVEVPARRKRDARGLPELAEWRVLIDPRIHLQQGRDAGNGRTGVRGPPVAAIEPGQLELEEVPRRETALPGKVVEESPDGAILGGFATLEPVLSEMIPIGVDAAGGAIDDMSRGGVPGELGQQFPLLLGGA